MVMIILALVFALVALVAWLASRAIDAGSLERAASERDHESAQDGV